jgi:lipopolysaccharide/colanic/teichoic acid biosynthesis glycosyltransferase
MTELPALQEPEAPAERRRGEQLEQSGTLAERYSRLAGSQYRPRPMDVLLRGLDVVVAGAALLVASPLIALIALAVLLTSGRPVLYRGLRVGRAGRIFTMYKFRTLRPDAETRLGPYLGEELTRRTQDELTRLGRVLRGSQLDELPQLFNVLRGDMSIVGPRPIRPAFFEELCEQIPQYWQRLVVRPGLTGFAQLRITREMTWAEKLAHDLEYIADRSVRLYVRVCFATGVRIARGIARGGEVRPLDIA